MELGTLIAEAAGCHPMKYLCFGRAKVVSFSVLQSWGKRRGAQGRAEEGECPTASSWERHPFEEA